MKILEFQKLIKELYFQKDKSRGLNPTFIWLVEEIGELAQILNKGKIVKNKVEEELADIVAWTCSIANLLDVNLESALSRKYPNFCIKCKSNPCIC